MPDVRVLAVTADDLLALRDEAIAVAGPDALARLRTGRPGYRGCTARGADGRLVGFAYGWEGGPGDWWWDLAAGAVNEDVRRRWFADCFELVELAVLPGSRRSGIGTALHDAVLAQSERPHQVLSARCDAEDVRAFCASRGWRTVMEAMRFPGDEASFAILVRDRVV